MQVSFRFLILSFFLIAFFVIPSCGLAQRVCLEVPWNTGEADMRCFEASMIFLTASSFRFPGHCHFLFGQTLGIPSDAFNPLSVEPGERYGVSKEKEEWICSLSFVGKTSNKTCTWVYVAYFSCENIKIHAHKYSYVSISDNIEQHRKSLEASCKNVIESCCKIVDHQRLSIIFADRNGRRLSVRNLDMHTVNGVEISYETCWWCPMFLNTVLERMSGYL